MKKSYLNAILSAALALTLCATMTGCGESRKSIEDMTESDFESALGELDSALSSNKTSSSTGSESSNVEVIDPFENLTVTFGGTAPDGTVSITSGRSDVSYKASRTVGVENGDIITVTASAIKSNTTLTETEKDYIVEGLPFYAKSLDQIPEDMVEKITNQSRDIITADCASWREGNSLKELELIGYYFLSVKEGFSVKQNNLIYCVFKVTANVTGLKKGGDGETEETAEETYYTHCSLSNLMMLDDETCSVDLSALKMTSNTIESEYGYHNGWSGILYKYEGYYDLDTMFNACVTQNIGSYNYENTVKG